jgi:hypothetical protein
MNLTPPVTPQVGGRYRFLYANRSTNDHGGDCLSEFRDFDFDFDASHFSSLFTETVFRFYERM